MKGGEILSRHIAIAAAVLAFAVSAAAQGHIAKATLAEPGEMSTEELRTILQNRRAKVFDARPFNEFAVSHIPGAVNVSPKPGVPMSRYVSDAAEIGRILKDEKSAAIVLYCNGPFCGKSKRLAAELAGAGFTNVRRYQLGIPVWRALGGVTVIEPAGLKYVFGNDRTAVLIDARDAAEFRAGSVAGARNIPRSLVKEERDTGEVRAAKDDGRLPMQDHNTRVVVFGSNAGDARYVAEAIAREAFHNVAYFEGGYREVLAAVGPKK